MDLLAEEWDRLVDALPENAITKAHVEGARADLLAALRPIAARVWEEGRSVGKKHERSLWQWQAGTVSRAVNGLTERPTLPTNPYGEV